MKKNIRCSLKLLIIGACIGVLTGCHTVQGLGEDIASGGKALSRGAAETSHKMDSQHSSRQRQDKDQQRND